jgi:CheY-like chemotaxis protein
MATNRKSGSQGASYRHQLTNHLLHKTPRVLIVDDEQLGTELRVAVLRSLGYDAAMSKSGIEAVARPDLDTFDVIVLDYDMPQLNGVETARRLKKSGVDARLVMLSGRVDAPSHSKRLIDVFVSKGEGVPNLTSAIQKALDKRTYH